MAAAAELAERYSLTEEEVRSLREELAREFGEVPGVFQPEGEGFTSWLHYQVFTCRAM